VGVLVASPLLAFFGWLFQSCTSARTTAHTFVTAIREGRLAEAHAMADPSLHTKIVKGSPLLVAMQSSTGELGVVQSGFGDRFEAFGCFDGRIDDARRFWIVTRKVREGWRVVDLQETMPKICEGSE
jgi:hypothetical protein